MNEESEQPLKILIADDSNSDRLLLKAIVQNQGHIPMLASDGLEAVDIFNVDKPDIILLDALMPNMDGFDTARYIKAHSEDHFIPIIFLTSLNEADSLAQCLEAGGDDFLTKPYNSVILKAKINAFKRMLKMHVTLQHQRDQIAENNQRLIQEQEVAKRTFDKVAHEGALHAHNIKYTMSPMAIFNGDVLLAAVRPNGNLCMLLGDFTGHGLAAAIGAMPLSQTFYSMVAKGFSVKDVVTELNRKLKEILPVGVFCCTTMIDMDFMGKSVEIWNGGMPDNYLYSPQDMTLQEIPSRHLALGILDAEKFNAMTEVYPMRNGDRFYMWSDGIIEASNNEGEMFGNHRLKDIFKHNVYVDFLFTEINEKVSEFIGDSERDDDLSIAEIRMVDRKEFEKYNPKPLKVIDLAPMDWCFTYEVRPDTLRTTDPLPVLQKILMDVPGLRPRSGELFTVMSELYSNALEHGVLGLKSEMKQSPSGFTEYYRQRIERLADLSSGAITFELDYKGDQYSGVLTLTVKDSGDGFDYEKRSFDKLGHEDYSGRGLHLVDSICQSVTYHGDGNIVQAVFDWKSR